MRDATETITSWTRFITHNYIPLVVVGLTGLIFTGTINMAIKILEDYTRIRTQQEEAIKEKYVYTIPMNAKAIKDKGLL